MSYVPYQIDFLVTSAGKTLGASKKKITFKFGFANKKALGDGLSGSNCRGSEHEVNFIWSLNSGKRQISLDGKEIYFSESGLNGWTNDRNFQHVFPLHSPNDGTIKCHLISVPATPNVPGDRPFDLRLNGVSYFTLCKIFQLGTPSMIVRPAPADAGYSRRVLEDELSASPAERKLIAAAKIESLKSLGSSSRETVRRQTPAIEAKPTSPLVREEANLINFDDDAPPANQITGIPNRSDFASSLTLDTTLQRTVSVGDDRTTNSYLQAYGATTPQTNLVPQYSYGNYPQPPAYPQQQQQPSPAYPQQQQQPSPAYSQQQQPSPAYSQQQPSPAYPQESPSAYSQQQLQPAYTQQSTYAQQQQPAYPQEQPAFQQEQQPTYQAQAQPTFQQQPAQQQWGAQPSPQQWGAQPAQQQWGGQQSFQTPPAPTYEETQTAFTSNYAPPSIDTSMRSAPPDFASPLSYASYGSAPAFAQPPRSSSQSVPTYPQQQTYGGASSSQPW